MEELIKKLVLKSLHPSPENTAIEWKYLDFEEKEVIKDQETLDKVIEYCKSQKNG